MNERSFRPSSFAVPIALLLPLLLLAPPTGVQGQEPPPKLPGQAQAPAPPAPSAGAGPAEEPPPPPKRGAPRSAGVDRLPGQAEPPEPPAGPPGAGPTEEPPGPPADRRPSPEMLLQRIQSRPGGAALVEAARRRAARGAGGGGEEAGAWPLALSGVPRDGGTWPAATSGPAEGSALPRRSPSEAPSSSEDPAQWWHVEVTVEDPDATEARLYVYYATRYPNASEYVALYDRNSSSAPNSRAYVIIDVPADGWYILNFHASTDTYDQVDVVSGGTVLQSFQPSTAGWKDHPVLLELGAGWHGFYIESRAGVFYLTSVEAMEAVF